MNISMIAALTAKERGIGINGKLPWRLPEDMTRFREITSGHTVIMGRTTWESLPNTFRPLPNRRNIVLSRNPSFNPLGAECTRSVEETLELLKTSDDNEHFVIGGASIYKDFLSLAKRLYLTLIDQSFESDTFFPKFENSFPTIISEEYIIDNEVPTRFIIRER